jgi:polysaccharide export outer membrane protein
MFAALVALAGLSTLSWRAQLQTQQKLDALTTALANRASAPAPTLPTPAPAPAPASAPIGAQEPGPAPKELRAKQAPYVIEAPDTLLIEVVVKNPKTGTTDRLPDQPISGPFAVRPDGTVGLGWWGSVYVAGLTIDQAATAVRKRLMEVSEKVSAESLVVIVDVLAYNSKRYYVITDCGDGEKVYPFPCTSNETVLDALSKIDNLPGAAGKRSIWVARRAADAGQPWQTLTVDWVGITQQGITTTNYALQPGDRIYVTRTTTTQQ